MLKKKLSDFEYNTEPSRVPEKYSEVWRERLRGKERGNASGSIRVRRLLLEMRQLSCYRCVELSRYKHGLKDKEQNAG